MLWKKMREPGHEANLVRCQRAAAQSPEIHFIKGGGPGTVARSKG